MKPLQRGFLLIAFFFMASLIELWLFGRWKERWDHDTHSLLFLLSSFAIGLLAVLSSYWNYSKPGFSIPRGLNWLAWAGVFLLFYQPTLHVFSEFEIDYQVATSSDIIPQIHTMVDRLFKGVFPYQPIIDWGYELFPTYLTMTWLPFSIPYVADADYRWFALGLLMLSMAAGIYKWGRNAWVIIPLIFLGILIRHTALYQDTALAWTVETMILGFYLLLMFTFQSQRTWLIVGGILLCLLSRYSLVIWLPILFLYLWKANGFPFSFRAGLMTLAGVLLLYVFPFFLQDTSIYKRGMQHHSKAAINEWNGQPWQAEGDPPYTLYTGIGMASRFFEAGDDPVEDRLQRLQRFHAGGLIGITAILGFLLWFSWDRLRDPGLFLVGSLKVYLAFFYHFIQIPYAYLYIVLIGVNIGILFWLIKKN